MSARRRSVAAVVVVAVGVLAGACGTSKVELDARLGGDTTREDTSRNSFGLPAPELTNTERRRFERGDSFFTQNWVTSPASTDARDGLGPMFNAQACSSCHILDGRGLLPTEDDDAALGLLFRLSVPGEDPDTGAPVPDAVYGGQLQDRAVLDVPAEGTMGIDYLEIPGIYGDGTPYGLRSPTYSIADPAFGEPSTDLLIGPRLAPQVIGMGLLEAIPDSTLLAHADPDDEDGDGISGRVNMVWGARAGEQVIGRFGWKANVATVEEQVAGAFHGDLGVTSSLHPDENCTMVQLACLAAPNGGAPELTDDRLESVTLYSRTLSVPAMRDIEDPEVQEGAQLFADAGCSSCHLPTLETGDTDIDALSRQTIHPYTDLLLHDMGDDLGDGRPDFQASGTEWRTPPLWGLGLIEAVNGSRFLLHDGRARTIEEAILWHGGEGAASRDAFRDLDGDQRDALVAFLEAL